MNIIKTGYNINIEGQSHLIVYNPKFCVTSQIKVTSHYWILRGSLDGVIVF